MTVSMFSFIQTTNTLQSTIQKYW